MQLADIRNDFDPIRVLFTEYLSRADLTRLCSAMRNTSPGTRNDLLDEGLMGNLGKAAILKSKAATMIPADIRDDPNVSKLIDIAKKADHDLASDEMGKWWLAAAKAIVGRLGGDPQALIATALPKVKEEAQKLADEVAAGKTDVDTSRGQKDELSGLKADLKHKAALKKLKQRYGHVDEPDQEAQAAEKRRKAKTLAKMIGMDYSDDLDYDTMRELIGSGAGDDGARQRGKGGSGSMLRNINMLRKLFKRKADLGKKAAALPKEDAQRLLYGLARMVVAEATMSEGPRWDAFKRMLSGASMPIRYALGAAAAPFKAGATAYDDWQKGGEGHKKAGAGFLSLFSRQGRDQMGSSAVGGAIKSYLIALAISTMVKTAESAGAMKNVDDEEAQAQPAQPAQPAAKQSGKPGLALRAGQGGDGIDAV